MSRRIEVELTSIKDESNWTWRAAGAKKPKGDLPSSMLYEGAKVGDIVKVEADFHVDGIEVVEVFVPKGRKERTNLLEMMSRPLRDDELVTTKLSRDKGDRKSGRKSGGRDNRSGGNRSRDDRPSRPRKPEVEQRPKPKRLRPKRVHRDAYLASVAEEHRPIVEQVVRDGMPGVRAAIDKQSAEAKEAGKPAIDPTPIIAIAEQHLTPARLAEWHDKSDAAIADADELDLRDLRSLVVAGADVARDDETRAAVEKLREVLERRLEADHTTWLSDVSAAVNEGRVVRGLRLSSRPVKAGAPLPTEIASKLSKQASEALAPDVAQDRWATVLDALAYSPVRGAVKPAGIPAEPKEELIAEVKRLSDRLPAIAGLFGIDPADVPKSAKRRQPRRNNKNTKPKRTEGKKPESKKSETPKVMRPVPGAEKPADAVVETPNDQVTDAGNSTATEPVTDDAPRPATDAGSTVENDSAEPTAPEVVAEEVQESAPVVTAEATPDIDVDTASVESTSEKTEA